MKPKFANVEERFSEKTPILSGENSECSAGMPARYALTLLGFLGFFNVYAMRVNLSVAMVAMVDRPALPLPPAAAAHGTVACLELVTDFRNDTSPLDGSLRGEFDWDSRTQALVLGSFFYGYVVTQIPGGVLAEKCGAKWLLGGGVLLTSLFTLLTPLAARWGVGALIAARAIEGLGEGVTFPAMNVLIGHWVPKLERSRLATFVFTGCPIGTVASLVVSGVLSDSQFFGGWPSVFYLFGTLGCAWFVLWAWLVHEKPEDHPRISKAELLHIRRGQDDDQHQVTSIPWRSIVTSVPVWALVVTHFGQNWGYYTLLTEMPTFLSNILHFDIKKNGVLSALPYLMNALFACLASAGADKLRSRGHLSVTAIRKICNSVAFFGPGVCVLCVAFAGCHPPTIVVLLSLSLGLNGFMYSGYNVTHLDMSPQFAGTLMGITNCIANFAGFLAPAFVGRVIEDGQTLRNWGVVFVTTSAVFFLSGAVFNVFCTAERQTWGRRPSALPRTS